MVFVRPYFFGNGENVVSGDCVIIFNIFILIDPRCKLFYLSKYSRFLVWHGKDRERERGRERKR